MRTLTRKEVAILVELLGGDDAVRMMVGKACLPEEWVHPKYPDLTSGQIEALLNIALTEISVECLPDILAGRLTPKWEEVAQLLVARNGRCILEGLRGHVVNANRNFYQVQPVLDTVDIAALLARHREFCSFPGAVFPSADEVETRYHAILEWLNLSENEKNGVKNLLNAPHFVGILPQIPTGDHGAILELLVEAAGKSYLKQFPNRRFYHTLRGQLAGNVEIADGTRYGEFVRRAAKGSLIWVSFRTCLHGFSILADHEQEAKMPSRFILSGGWDTAVDIIGYPEILARDFNTPGLDMAALQWSSAGYSLCFKANDSYLHFNPRSLPANGHCSGGLLLLGPACR